LGLKTTVCKLCQRLGWILNQVQDDVVWLVGGCWLIGWWLVVCGWLVVKKLTLRFHNFLVNNPG